MPSTTTIEEFRRLAIETIGRTLGAAGVRHWCALLQLWRERSRSDANPSTKFVYWTLNEHLRFLGLPEDDGTREEVARVCSALADVWVEIRTESAWERIPLMIVLARGGPEPVHASGTDLADEMVWHPGSP